MGNLSLAGASSCLAMRSGPAAGIGVVVGHEAGAEQYKRPCPALGMGIPVGNASSSRMVESNNSAVK